VAHYCAAIAATAAVIWVWRRSQALEVRAMALVAGTFMLSPYIYNYDAAWLAIPVALFTARALQHGWLRWEREALVIAWLYPVLGDIGGYGAHVGIGPLVFSLLLFVAVRRAHLQPGAVAAGLPAGPLVRCAWFRRAGIR
jgi:alpha-1,2-mannosyltransferase